MRLLPATPNPIVWPILAVAAAATAVAAASLGFSAPTSSYWMLIVFSCGLLGAAVFGHTVLKMPPIAEPLSLAAFWVAMVAVLLPASYIAAAFNMPLADEAMSRLDQLTGFNWVWLQRWVAGDADRAHVSYLIYRYSIVQVAIAVFSLAAIRDITRLNTYFTGLLIATIVMVVLSALFPALSAYPFYGVTKQEMGHILTHIPLSSHLHDVLALRNGTLRHLDIEWDGIITFPSYHAIVALTAGWASWRVRFIGPLNAVFTVLVLIVTLPIGSHYLMDLVGAAAVCAVSLAYAARIEGRRFIQPEETAVTVPTFDDEPSVVWTSAAARHRAEWRRSYLRKATAIFTRPSRPGAA